MKTVHAPKRHSNTVTIHCPSKIVKGHPVKRGSGTHTNTADKRQNRRTRTLGAIREYE